MVEKRWINEKSKAAEEGTDSMRNIGIVSADAEVIFIMEERPAFIDSSHG